MWCTFKQFGRYQEEVWVPIDRKTLELMRAEWQEELKKREDDVFFKHGDGTNTIANEIIDRHGIKVTGADLLILVKAVQCPLRYGSEEY